MSAYATAVQFKAWLDFDSDVAFDSDLIDEIIQRASGLIDSYCGRNFDVASDIADATRYFDPLEDVLGQILYLDRDLAAITSVTNGNGVAVAASDYVTLPQGSTDGQWYGIKLKDASGLTWTYTGDHEQSIAIVGKWTYSVTTPDVITHACLRLSQWIYKMRSSDAVSDNPIVMTSGLTIMPGKLPADVMAMLEPFRLLRMGAWS